MSPWLKPLMQELQSLWFDVTPPVDALVQERPVACLQRLGQLGGGQDLPHHRCWLALAKRQSQQWSTAHARTQVREIFSNCGINSERSWMLRSFHWSQPLVFLPRYASHLGLPAVMLQLHGTNHTNLARFEHNFESFSWISPQASVKPHSQGC